VDTSKFTPGVIVILAAALVMLIFSFLPFFKLDVGGGARDAAEQACEGLPDDLADACRDALGDVAGGGGDQNFNAWNNDGLFPLATLPLIYGLIMAIQIALAKFANVKFPERIVGLTFPQIHIALGVNATLIMLAYLLLDKDPLDFGIGFFFMLIGAIALAVGAFIYQREEATSPGTAPPPPPPPAPPSA
jgi:hypothetical protein